MRKVCLTAECELQACELYKIPDNAPVDFRRQRPAFSSISAGFLPEPQEGAPSCRPCTSLSDPPYGVVA